MKIKHLVLHCTATPEGRAVSSKQIRQWHTSPPPQGRGWRQVGYTDMIHLDGQVERLIRNNEDSEVDTWEISNGAKGTNSVSRHVVYVGGVNKDGVPTDTRTLHQKQAMAVYVIDFIRRFPWVIVAGHNQFANKACPSFDVPEWLDMLGVDHKNIKK